MTTIWDPDAIESLRDVANYIKRSFGKKARQNFMLKVYETEELLKRNPDIAQKDPLFEDRADVYRSIFINNLSRLVYRVDGDVVNIVGFWDCRRDPVAQAKRVK